MNPEVASAASFEKARNWIEECFQNHHNCPALRLLPLPTRVVDVAYPGDGKDWVRLHLGEGICKHYVALSYCWGMPRQPVETTKATLRSHIQDGIAISWLPDAIRDAIEVTRNLRVRYLWIDSLCIVQDDKEDKTKEISEMRRIFSNAYCTISAASVGIVTDGFLQTRGTHSSHTFSLPYPCPDGALGTMTLGENVGRTYFQFYDPSADPINHRAWTLEEKLLSPRVLIYTSTHLRWLCDTDEYSDGGNPYAGFDTQAERLPFRTRASADGSVKIADKVELKDFFERWRYILEEYTNRTLTKPKDKLRALSGVADYFHKLTSDQYLAGLWRADLAYELVWIRQREAKRRPPHRAPSWSWASVNSLITFLSLPERREYFHCEILECIVVPLSDNAPFGAVKSGTLRLKGLLRQVPWSAEAGALLGSSGERIGSAIVDTEEGASLSDTSWCLAVSALRRDDGGFNAPSGLILSPAEGCTNQYSRIGAFVTSDRLLFDGCEQQEILIC